MRSASQAPDNASSNASSKGDPYEQLSQAIQSRFPSEAPRKNYCPHEPTPKQAQFLQLECREAFFGGAAGGGKSDALLMAALEWVHLPGYAGILFRRSYADLSLPGAIMDRAKDWLAASDARWNDNTKTFTFPSGATLTFAYLAHEQDKYRYQGAEFHFIAFDELTHFTQTQYVYLFSRCRRAADCQIPLRVRAASNPGGVGHDWVFARFIESGNTDDRIFIPARLDDNPHLDTAEYEVNLGMLDPITRAQLRHGDWNIRAEGGVFCRDWFSNRYKRIPVLKEVWTTWDLALKDKEQHNQTACCTMGLGENGGVYVLRAAAGHWATPDVEKFLIRQADWLRSLYGDAYRGDYIEDKVSGTTLMQYTRRTRPDLALIPVKVDADKVSRAQGITPICEAGQVLFPDFKIFPQAQKWTTDLINQLCLFPQEGVMDDQVDAFVYGLKRFMGTLGRKGSRRGKTGGFV